MECTHGTMGQEWIDRNIVSPRFLLSHESLLENKIENRKLERDLRHAWG
jgi:hypothetical protein